MVQRTHIRTALGGKTIKDVVMYDGGCALLGNGGEILCIIECHAIFDPHGNHFEDDNIATVVKPSKVVCRSKPSLKYSAPTVAPDWADSRNTHIAVATAIHAISDSKRTPEQIWTAPTDTEVDHVIMAVRQYIDAGIFPANEWGQYAWGDETLRIC